MSADNSNPENYLEDFVIKRLQDSSLVCAKKKYFLRVISPKSNCEILDNLRYGIYKMKEKALNELPPTSSAIHWYLLRSHYFVYLCSNLLDNCSNILEPENYGWIIENGLLVPTKNFATVPSYLTTKCCCKKGLYKELCL